MAINDKDQPESDSPPAEQKAQKSGSLGGNIVAGFLIFLPLFTVGTCIYAAFDDSSRPAIVRPEANNNAKAVTACREIVRNSAVYGSKADFNGWSRRYGTVGGKLAVQEEVELMNGLGLMVPHTYLCVYDGGAANLISLNPGSG